MTGGKCAVQSGGCLQINEDVVWADWADADKFDVDWRWHGMDAARRSLALALSCFVWGDRCVAAWRRAVRQSGFEYACE